HVEKVTSGTATPMTLDERVFKLRAIAFGRYPSWAIAWRTRSRVSGLTNRVRFVTAETVACDTPARRATSRLVAAGALVTPIRRPHPSSAQSLANTYSYMISRILSGGRSFVKARITGLWLELAQLSLVDGPRSATRR